MKEVAIEEILDTVKKSVDIIEEVACCVTGTSFKSLDVFTENVPKPTIIEPVLEALRKVLS
jgi:hypothetical protein